MTRSPMLKLIILIGITAKINAQNGKHIGDMCIPGMCVVLNSNCKWNGQIFKCVCKDNYLSVNQTHCGYSLSVTEDNACKHCIEKEALCVDYNNDKRMDGCWCSNANGCVRSGKNRNMMQPYQSSNDAEFSISFVNAVTNKQIVEGGTLSVGESVLISIKSEANDPDYKVIIENCSLSALSNHHTEENPIERIDLIRTGCTRKNAYSSTNLSFRSVSDVHLESNLFEVFKLRTSSVLSLNCWLQVCAIKSKCIQRICPEIVQNSAQNGHNVFNVFNQSPDEMNHDDSEFREYKNAAVHFLVDESDTGFEMKSTYLNQKLSAGQTYFIDQSKSFDSLAKPIIVSIVIIIFTFFVSVSSIIIYRICVKERIFAKALRNTETLESECYASDKSCKYEINGRGGGGDDGRYDEKFFAGQHNHHQTREKQQPHQNRLHIQQQQHQQIHHQPLNKPAPLQSRNISRW